MTFLVLGRPRSRTAWVANLLATPPVSSCLHEGLADCGASPRRLRARLASLPGEAGNADTGLIHCLDAVLSEFPEARLVLMTGGEQSWRRWCSRNGIHPEVRARIDADYRRAEKLLRGRARFVDCGAVTSDEGEARGLWEHCLPGHPFDPQRWAVLRDLNIQVIPRALARRVASLGLPASLGLLTHPL